MVPSHLPSSYDVALTGLRSVTAAVSLKSDIETAGVDAGNDAFPVAQSCPRLSTRIAKPAVALLTRDVGDLAVIDRLDETRLDQPAFEKGAAPFETGRCIM